MKAQREFELKDGPKGRRLRRCAKRILDFKFSLRCSWPCDLWDIETPSESDIGSKAAA